MATKVLDLLLQLSVKGSDQADALRKSVESLKTATEGLRGRSLDDILNGTKAKTDLDLIVGKSKTLIDLLAEGGRTPLDVNLGKMKQPLDLAVSSSRSLLDLFVQVGRQPLDVNLTKLEAEAKRARTEALGLATQMGRVGASAQGAGINNLVRDTTAAGAGMRALGVETKSLTDKLQNAGSEFLFFRRIVLGLGLLEFGKQIIGVAIGFDQMRQSLSAVFGETQAKVEFEFIRQAANRLGLDINVLTDEYAKLSIATRAIGLTSEQTRDIFLAVAEAGARLHLSQEQIQGALLAVQQMASKGVVSMEELRRQLGNSLPGATAIAAKALGVTEAKLFQLVSSGQLASKVLLTEFPAALRAAFGTDATTQIDTTQAAIARFKNALKLTIDEAIRAGALDVFINALKGLTTLLQDPSTIDHLKKFSEGIKSFAETAVQHAGTIKFLLEAFLAYKGLAFLRTLFDGFGGKLAIIAGAARESAQGANALDTALGKLADGTAKTEGALSTLMAQMSVIAGLAKGPIAILITVAVVGAAAAQAVLDVLKKKKDAEDAAADATRTAASQERIVAQLTQDRVKANEQYIDVAVKATDAVNKMGAAELQAYNRGLEGALALAEGQKAVADNAIIGARAQLAAGNLTMAQQDVLIRQIDKLKTESADAAERVQTLSIALADTAKHSQESGIALDPFVGHLQRLADQLVNNQAQATKTAGAYSRLDKATQAMVDGFSIAGSTATKLQKAIEGLLPTDTTISGMGRLADVLAALVEKGTSAPQLIDGIAKSLAKLSTDNLAKFQTASQAAFEIGGHAAEGMAIILTSTLHTALQKMGIDAEDAGKNVSKAFSDLATNASTVLSNVLVTSDQIKGVIEKGISTAKTREELTLLKSVIESTGIAGSKMTAGVEDALVRLDDHIRLTTGVLDSALGDSFKRLGIDTALHLKSLADQAEVDFNRIRASGQATAQELRAAFAKFAEEATKANNGIPPIKIVIQAVNMEAFDIIVKAAETASQRVKNEILKAIPLAETKTQAEALSDAIVEAFDKGKISVQDFGLLVTQVGFQIRELAAKPVGELAAAADLLQLKTKDQLKAVSDNFREAFQSISGSGQFTSDQLAKGAQEFLDAYKAANNGVVDSFDPVVEKALEVLQAVNADTDALDKLKNKADSLSNPVDLGNLNDKTAEELQFLLRDTIKAYRDLGIQNVQDLQYVQAIQKVIDAKAKANADAVNKAADDAAKALNEAAKNVKAPINAPAGGGIGGGAGVVFNFNGTGLTPDQVKRNILPVLTNISKRAQ